MLTFNPEKKDCTGCAACYSACPVHCISMTTDHEGFLYPEASDACIHCGLCEKVCPTFQQKRDLSIEQKAMAAVTNDRDIWQRSASGGAFSEICRYWADADTLIVGAAWDGLKVHHIGVTGFDNIAPLCKSKYVSSAIEDTFIQIKEALSLGRKAVFCGCPCQVAGLKSFLKQDYDNLLTIDLICHGQGSPTVFKACINYLSAQLGGKIEHYEFRAKRKYYEIDYLCRVKIQNKDYYLIKDPYTQLFLSQNILRPSCGEHCQYRDVRRPGDLTIADLKGFSKLFPDLFSLKKNWSTIVSNTRKGLDCLNKLSGYMELRDISLNDVIKYNPLFAKQTWFSKNRETFFFDFMKNPDLAISKWTIPAVQYRTPIMKRIIWTIPDSFLRLLNKCISQIYKFNFRK